MKFRLLMASSFLFFAVTAGAADSTGNFNVGGGTGGVKCPSFVAEMEKARSLGIDEPTLRMKRPKASRCLFSVSRLATT